MTVRVLLLLGVLAACGDDDGDGDPDAPDDGMTCELTVALDEPLFAPVQLQLANDAAGWAARLEAKS